MHPDLHVSDQDLVQFADGELDAHRAGAVETHLTHCWTCRTRADELARAVTAFVELRNAELGMRIPESTGPEARLRAVMSQMFTQAPAAGIALSLPRGFRLAAATLGTVAFGLAVALIALTYGRQNARNWLPDSRLTPGATRSISTDQVCRAQITDEEQVPGDLTTQVFHEYRIDRPRPRMYEVDYLITPALGGARDIRNLWPQRYGEGAWNSRVKDALEDRLRDLVCSGHLDLETAQHELASDWIAAYRKYFRTDRPLAAHALFIKDHPWE